MLFDIRNLPSEAAAFVLVLSCDLVIEEPPFLSLMHTHRALITHTVMMN